MNFFYIIKINYNYTFYGERINKILLDKGFWTLNQWLMILSMITIVFVRI